MRSMVEGARTVKKILKRQVKRRCKRPSHRANAIADALRRRHFSSRRPKAAYAPLPTIVGRDEVAALVR
jgi:hypothetical protein